LPVLDRVLVVDGEQVEAIALAGHGVRHLDDLAGEHRPTAPLAVDAPAHPDDMVGADGEQRELVGADLHDVRRGDPGSAERPPHDSAPSLRSICQLS